MTDLVTISKEVPKNSALSYEFLREEGIKLIQQLGGNTWTDHNIHDPGITILEQVCYAITDLAYRMDYDIKELLGSNTNSSYTDLYSAATILSTKPVTLLDLRKIVMDIEGVKNAWVEKVTQNEITNELQETFVPKGLYRVFVELDPLFEITGTQLLTNVKDRLQASRSICEDFEVIKILEPQQIRLEGAIEIADTVDDINQLVVAILHRVATNLSPQIPFYTLQQLLKKGKKTEEIFDGPSLDHGFIDEADLLKHERKKEIQTSDIIREIMDEVEVLAIDELALATGSNLVRTWILPLDTTKVPKLDVEGTLEKLLFMAKGLTVNLDKVLIKTLYNEKQKEGFSKKLPIKERDIITEETKEQHLENYFSIQNQFPSNYGIGVMGLPDSAPESRKAQAKQLTAYLVFFEQLLGNYFSQLANFKKLMSFDDQDTRTYFNQSLLDSVAGLEDVLVSKESYEQYLEERTADSTEELKRKNKFLNHLLARFGEKFTGYGMLLQDVSETTHATDKKLIKDKVTFLKEYPILSANRATAYDYTKTYWQNDNISGLEKRIARKLGIEEYTRRNLGDGNTEGFHMVEHILLRPRKSYPFALNVSYSPKEIISFEAVETNVAMTRCMVSSHTLKIGEEIQISANEIYQENYTISSIGDNYFEIEAPFQEATATGLWQHEQDIRYFIKTANIGVFKEVASSSDRTFCEVGKNSLQVNDFIEITRTQHYNGVYQVLAVFENGFEIAVPFSEGETTGRWMPLAIPNDPYSLQLTFVFPKWMERYQNTSFRKFVEQTVREETPAHITAYIKWFDSTEMQDFDKSFQTFLGRINNQK
ncbi:hypothetical protein FIA58_000170 [Flavobacterium jejuense]|uniref:Uncharacterized protein n=1 Tax=Flavobacterium jejuense TaxID=1544455 RepID=A0ABX0IJS8_9FLAO|nr:hypothetical protein [Flavobacterium jejuense]NHN24077.1 hypothetical protein [Flavobacterium jejuense]